MITGKFDERMVYVDDKPLDLERSLKLIAHSPTGFMWGYLGSGPSQLALALLLRFGATDQEALSWYQQLKRDVVATLPQQDFTINDGLVTDWLEARRIFAANFKEDTE